jgi:Mechanosensitive ion channel
MVGEHAVFNLSAARAGKSAEERAKAATKVLEKILESTPSGEPHAVAQGNNALVAWGDTAIVTLSSDDARIAGEESAEGFAQTVAAAIGDAVESEQQRGKIDKRVFSGSLVVLFGLIAFYLLRKTSEWAEQARGWLEERGDSLSIRVRQMEIVAPEVVETAALFALGALKWLVRFGILYAWLLTALSMFESTRGYTQRLTGWVLAPLSELTERVASTLPVLVVAALALVAIWILLRFVQLLFEAVARRETTLAWVPADLARPTSVLVRLVIVLAALIFAAPVVTGDTDGPLARTGLLALLSLGIAATPLVASALVGAINVFGRRLRVGDHVEVRQHRGRVTKLGLFELSLELQDTTELRLPHVVLTWSSLRLLGPQPALRIQLAVQPDAAITACESALTTAANDGFSHVRVTLARADRNALCFVVTARGQRLAQEGELLAKLVQGLRAQGIGLGVADDRS